MANKPSVSWSETTPAGSESLSLGDNRIREMKSQLREVLAQNHEMGASGQGENWGKHNKVELIEQVDLGTGAEGLPILGAMTSGGKAELAFVTEDDDVILFTEDGKLGNSATSVVLKDIDIKESIGVSGAVSIGGALSVEGAISALAGLNLTESTAPSTAANVGALYTKNDGTQTELYFREEASGDEVQVTKGGRVNVGFGAYETTDASQVGGSTTTLATGTIYQASKSGYVIAAMKYSSGSSNSNWFASLTGKIGATSSPSTEVGYAGIGSREAVNSVGRTDRNSFPMFVSPGQYWTVTKETSGTVSTTDTLYFVPLS